MCTAIAEQRLLLFSYNGSRRLVYPCAHGLLSTGNEALRAHEVAVPSLGKLYLLASMDDVQVCAETFGEPPRGYRRDDRGMAQVHCQL